MEGQVIKEGLIAPFLPLKVLTLEYNAGSMDIRSEKYELVEWPLSIEDEELISELKNIKDKNSSDPEETQLSDMDELLLKQDLKI